jgi:ComF family protein
MESTLAVMFPSPCVLCHRELTASLVGGLCAECWSGLECWHGSLCFRCGLPLAASVDSPRFTCAGCRLREPRFDVARSYGVYAGKLRAAVLQLKFHRRETLGARLGRLLLDPWQSLESGSWSHNDPVIVPVPLHRARERERGYNQAELLARGLLRAMKEKGETPKLDVRAVARTQSTLPQSGLSLRGRSENVRHAFEVLDGGRVRDLDMILVDDVMTTGATASACAAALRRAGARRVVMLTLARATPQFPDVAPLTT